MGPTTLFDKSFLQSLSVDESVWFDQFFIANVCPLFYVETLADLGKNVRVGRTSEEEVRLIADKFPDISGAPNAHHAGLCINNLLGHKVPMTSQIPIAGGRFVKNEGKSGLVFEKTPEAEAFSRWQKGEFFEVEHQYAQAWRKTLSTLDLDEIAEIFRALGIDGKSCKTLEAAKTIADNVVIRRDKPFERMKLALVFLNIPTELHRPILERWSLSNYLPLADYAPYVAHVLTVEIFFQIALAAQLIASERSSNCIDIAYLFYLPFCMMFVSFDKLHRRCAPLFLRPTQQFVWGNDLKSELSRLNIHYAGLPESIKEKGVMAFAGEPPLQGDFLTTQIWDRHLPNWRERKAVDVENPKFDHSKLAEMINKMKDAPTLASDEVDFDPTHPDGLMVQRSIRKRKGSWYQLPKKLMDTDE